MSDHLFQDSARVMLAVLIQWPQEQPGRVIPPTAILRVDVEAVAVISVGDFDLHVAVLFLVGLQTLDQGVNVVRHVGLRVVQ